MINVPLKKDVLHSTIDYNALISIQANNEVKQPGKKGAVKVKSNNRRLSRTNMIHRGGRND